MDGPYGIWEYEVSYQGQIFTHPLTVTGVYFLEIMSPGHIEQSKILKE